MTKRPFLLLTFAVWFIFAYLLLTVVPGRYEETLAIYQDLQEKRATIIDPIALQRKEGALHKELDSLSAMIRAQRNRYQQNEVGVIQCVSDEVRKDQVALDTFTPGSHSDLGQFDEFNFGVSAKGKFAKIGTLVNAIENAEIPFDVMKVQLVSDPIGNTIIHVNLQIKASLYHGIR